MRASSIVGQKYGRLTVIEQTTSRDNNHNSYWRCICECGSEIIVARCNLRSGHTRSCGCLAREQFLINREYSKYSKHNTKHGKRYEKIYGIWKTMRRRCDCPSQTGFHRWGGREITVCQEWQNDFMSFYNWAMANGYSEGLTIDRINNNGNYDPKNCRWTTIHQQCANRRNNTDFVGVSYNQKTGRYKAYLRKDGKHLLCRTFKTKEAAIAARLDAEIRSGVVIDRKKRCVMENNSENLDSSYPFFEEWLQRQSEPLPDFGTSVFGTTEKTSALALDQLPGRQNETLFERKEKE